MLESPFAPEGDQLEIPPVPEPIENFRKEMADRLEECRRLRARGRNLGRVRDHVVASGPAGELSRFSTALELRASTPSAGAACSRSSVNERIESKTQGCQNG